MIFNQIAPSMTENLTDVTNILNVADSYTGGLLGYGIWLIIFFSSIMVTSSFKPTNVFISSALITTMASIFLWIFNLINGWLLFISVVIFIISVFFTIKETPGA